MLPSSSRAMKNESSLAPLASFSLERSRSAWCCRQAAGERTLEEVMNIRAPGWARRLQSRVKISVPVARANRRFHRVQAGGLC